MEEPIQPSGLTDSSDSAARTAPPGDRLRFVILIVIAVAICGVVAFEIHTRLQQFHDAMDRRYGAQYYAGELDRMEAQLKQSPDSREVALVVVAACRKLAEYAEASGKGEAGPAWHRAWEILNGMKETGQRLSPGHEEFYGELRAKLGK